MEFPTFLEESVFVATCTCQRPCLARRAHEPYLCKNIVDLLTGLRITPAKDTQQAQDLDLKEGVGDTVDVMLGGIARAREALEHLHKVRCQRLEHLNDTELVSLLLVSLAHASDQYQAANQDTVVAVREQHLGLLEEVLLQVGDLAADSHGANGSLPADVGVRAGEDRLDFGKEIAGHFD